MRHHQLGKRKRATACQSSLLACAVLLAPGAAIAQTSTPTEDQRNQQWLACDAKWNTSDASAVCTRRAFWINDNLECQPDINCAATVEIVDGAGLRLSTTFELAYEADVQNESFTADEMAEGEICFGETSAEEYALHLEFEDCTTEQTTLADAQANGLPKIAGYDDDFVDNRADALLGKCKHSWQSSAASAHCETPTYEMLENERCKVDTDCSVTARVAAGKKAHHVGMYYLPDPVTIDNLCAGSRRYCWFGGGMSVGFPKRLNVCVTSENSRYKLRFAMDQCRVSDISADNAVDTGIPIHAEWARRERERLAGFPPGPDGLPQLRRGHLQLCINNWLDAGASSVCTLTSMSNDWEDGTNEATCTLSGTCQVTADVENIIAEVTIAEDVTWSIPIGGNAAGSVQAKWPRDKVDELDLCSSIKGAGDTANPTSLFAWDLVARECTTNERDGAAAQNSGLGWFGSDSLD